MSMYRPQQFIRNNSCFLIPELYKEIPIDLPPEARLRKLFEACLKVRKTFPVSDMYNMFKQLKTLKTNPQSCQCCFYPATAPDMSDYRWLLLKNSH